MVNSKKKNPARNTHLYGLYGIFHLEQSSFRRECVHTPKSIIIMIDNDSQFDYQSYFYCNWFSICVVVGIDKSTS